MGGWAPGIGAETPPFEELPALPPPTPWLLAALVLVFWLNMRIRILRRQLRRRQPGEPSVETWPWLHALAATTWILPALAVAAVLLGAGVAATFLLQ